MTTYTNTLYHYVHCPFCVRVRMGLGYLKVNYKSVVLSYDDEDTPVKLIGKKMLPILDTKHGFIGESLDIIKAFDESNVLFTTDFTNQLPQIEDLLTEIGANVHSLAMPYWMWTPEFSSNSRQYFKQKKEIKRGSFNLLVKNSHSFITDLKNTLTNIESNLTPYFSSDKITLVDILISAHLWGMYIVPEFQFSEKMHQYLQSVKAECNFNYHEDYWQ